MRLVAAWLGAFASLAACFGALASSDPFLWLEDVDGQRAQRWVRTQNQLTLSALRVDPEYAETLAEAEKIANAKDRLPYGNLADNHVHNFWQDVRHRRGIWRRTPLADYRDDDPTWETLIDVDALASAERKDWVWKGAECLPPAYIRCLVQLSQGAGEEIVVREFDAKTKAFVQGGFDVPESKTDISWIDVNTVMLATNWGRGSFTSKGGARVVRIWNRGEPLADAKTVFEAGASDAGVRLFAYYDRAGQPELFIVRTNSEAQGELVYVDRHSRLTPLKIPSGLEFKGFHKRQVLFRASRAGSVGGIKADQGSLLSFALEELRAGRSEAPHARALFMPRTGLVLSNVTIGRDAVYLSVLENVKGRIHEVTFDGQEWLWRRLNLPDNGTAEVVSASPADGEVLIKYANFVTPDRLMIATKGQDPKTIASLPRRFDADFVEVTQHEAISKDGTRVPYFFVRDEGARRDGSTPTLIYAYGGFQVSTTPWYWSSAGKLWLEKGGAYAVANVRGGGELGTHWHEAATRERRQNNFDDLEAVARDLIARGYTSPRRLGLIGSSQGGLLATGTFVQNPDLFNAVSAQVPLTDMLRYTRLSGGANLISEYGNPDDPRQRAAITRWSPYQNVRVGVRYPRAFFLTATRDERIHPAHARKMAAKLGAMGQPTLYFEAPATNTTRAEQLALTFTYFRQQLMDKD